MEKKEKYESNRKNRELPQTNLNSQDCVQTKENNKKIVFRSHFPINHMSDYEFSGRSYIGLVRLGLSPSV